MWLSELESLLCYTYSENDYKLKSTLSWINCSSKNMEYIFALFGLQTKSYLEYNDTTEKLNINQDVQCIWVNTKKLDHWCVIVRVRGTTPNDNEGHRGFTPYIYHYFDSMKNVSLYNNISRICNVSLKSTHSLPFQQNNDMCFFYVLLYAIQRFYFPHKNESSFFLEIFHANQLLKYVSSKIKYNLHNCSYINYKLA